MPRDDLDFIISLIPHEKAPVCLLRGGKLAHTLRVVNTTAAIQRWLENNIAGEPWKGRLVIQSPPWQRALTNNGDVLKLRNLTETAIAWKVLCDLRGIRTSFVPRTRWIVELLKSGLATRDPETDSIDTMQAAKNFTKIAIDGPFADVVCLAYYYHLAPAKEDRDELDERQI